MDWYLTAWQKYGQFYGRSRRSEYWWFALLNVCALVVLALLGAAGMGISDRCGAILLLPLVVYFVASIVPSFAVAVRRFHDTGKSGWIWVLLTVLGMIPLLGLIATVIRIILECTDGDRGPNQYGTDPKAYSRHGSHGGGGYNRVHPPVPTQPVARSVWPPSEEL